MTKHVAIVGKTNSELVSRLVPLWRSRRRQVLIAAVTLSLSGIGTVAWLSQKSADVADQAGSSVGAQRRLEGAVRSLPPPDLVRQLTPEDAIAANASRPISPRLDDPASKFALTGDALSQARALECLTQAIYYEAASEGADGGRAVAQIVLNRVRYLGYPNSVCEVVYQGSTRSTGCQFTFTCDGSLLRTPQSRLWGRSRSIAREALAGRVFSPVGHATHYHADYVVPYWADALDKIAVVGRHIFYRLRGPAGSVAAFRQRYAGREPQPVRPDEAAVTTLTPTPSRPEASALPDAKSIKVEADRAEVLSAPPKAEANAISTLQADLQRGALIAGETASARKPTPSPAGECKSRGPQKLRPIGSNELNARAAKSSC